ncbi:MAG: hypothetical protein ACK42K_07265 [Leptonema sp. (in: bacteria)]
MGNEQPKPKKNKDVVSNNVTIPSSSSISYTKHVKEKHTSDEKSIFVNSFKEDFQVLDAEEIVYKSGTKFSGMGNHEHRFVR